VLKYILFIFIANRNVNMLEDMLCLYKLLIVKTKQKNIKIAKEQLLLVPFIVFLMLCICFLLLVCVEIYS
jgi:hypothetical protein